MGTCSAHRHLIESVSDEYGVRSRTRLDSPGNMGRIVLDLALCESRVWGGTALTCKEGDPCVES